MGTHDGSGESSSIRADTQNGVSRVNGNGHALRAVTPDGITVELDRRALTAAAKATAKRTEEPQGDPLDAVRSWLTSNTLEREYLAGPRSLRFRAKVGAELRLLTWRLTSVRDLQIDAMEVVGSLDTFARSLHRGATAKHMYAALMDLVPWSRRAEHVNADADCEDEPTRLVRGLLFAQISFARRDALGVHADRIETTIAEEPGHFPGRGLSLWWGGGEYGLRPGRWYLAVNLTTASTTVLDRHPDFGKTRLSVPRIADILGRFPGVIDRKFRRGPFRHGRHWLLDVTAVLHPADDGTGGTPR